jgi:uncharacterized membrane protein
VKNLAVFLRTTLLGGVFFLVPIVVLAMILAKAHDMTADIVKPVTDHLPIVSARGVLAAKILAVVIILAFCFVAGLFASTRIAKAFAEGLETTILSRVPGYRFLKTVGEGMAGIEQDEKHETVLARIEEAWQIAFVVERLEGGNVVVFIPDAPSPWSGSIFIMTLDRIKPIQLPLTTAMKCIANLGGGLKKVLPVEL